MVFRTIEKEELKKLKRCKNCRNKKNITLSVICGKEYRIYCLECLRWGRRFKTTKQAYEGWNEIN